MVLNYDDLQAISQTHWGVYESPVRFPSDTATWETLSSPCHTYHLGRPMKLRELRAMPGDLQLRYLRKLRQLGATEDAVRKMLGATSAELSGWGVCFDRPNPAAWAEFLRQC